jgi:hypothetical protein
VRDHDDVGMAGQLYARQQRTPDLRRLGVEDDVIRASDRAGGGHPGPRGCRRRTSSTNGFVLKAGVIRVFDVRRKRMMPPDTDAWSLFSLKAVTAPSAQVLTPARGVQVAMDIHAAADVRLPLVPTSPPLSDMSPLAVVGRLHRPRGGVVTLVWVLPETRGPRTSVAKAPYEHAGTFGVSTIATTSTHAVEGPTVNRCQ